LKEHLHPKRGWDY